jgi:GNAT superfamily N-acetyltransferase
MPINTWSQPQQYLAIRHACIMIISAIAASVEEIVRWRDLYRQEMDCQIVHDSIHARPGWTEAFRLVADDVMVGYGLVAVSGPWKGKPTIFEYYVLPRFRSHVFELFDALLAASGAQFIETQTNDSQLSIVLLAYGESIECEKIVFHDRLTTDLPANGAILRPVTADDADQLSAQKLATDAGWLLEFDGTVAATGGILYHYNRPYGDIYMEVAGPFRRRGFGSYLVQELKRVCYEGGSIPAARCSPQNIASRTTLQRAGFVPCGTILVGRITSFKR